MIKIVQFGEGNFLRAFADVYFQTLKEEYGGYAVSIVVPLSRDLTVFRKQNCRYHAVLRGVKDGAAAETPYAVDVVEKIVDPYVDQENYYKLARDPELRIIVSNTTEAGICYNAADKPDDFAHMTYPAKLTLFLLERFRAGLDGVYLMPVELIDDNAAQLADCVRKYIELWKLPEDFAKWNRERCFYCSTLVDRIVSGYPRDEKTREHLYEIVGERDELVDVGEPFGLWVVENKGELGKYIKDGRHNIEVLLVDDVRPYKKRKVRILNGSHTNLVPVGLFMGAETVYDCMTDEKLSAFVRETLEEELLPFVHDGKAFADAMLDRFANPYLDHRLLSIALNSISKWRARDLPTFKDYFAANGRLPKHLTLGFGCLMALYARAERRDGGYVAKLPKGEVPLADDEKYLAYFADGGSVRAFMADEEVWGEDLTAIPGFADAAEEIVKKLDEGGSPL